MLVKSSFNINREIIRQKDKTEIYEPPEFRDTWYRGFFLNPVGDEAVRLVTTKFPLILRRYVHGIFILADDNEASAVYERVQHCFRSVLVIGLGIDGCGKNARLGYELLEPIKYELTFKINRHLNTLKSKYGILPSTTIELDYSGGTSSGYVLTVSEMVKELIRSLDSNANIINYVSISRGDYTPQIINSILVTQKLIKEMKENRRDRHTLIFSYFDREQTLRDLSDLNILNTVMTLLLANYRAGMNGLDITDILGRGGVFTTNTEHRSTTFLSSLKSLNADDVFNLAEKAIDFKDNSYHSRAVFQSRYAGITRFSVISPIPIADLETFGKKFQFAENVMADGYQLPIRHLPIAVTAFMKGNEQAIQEFLRTQRKLAPPEVIYELESYMDAEFVDEEMLEGFIRG